MGKFEEVYNEIITEMAGDFKNQQKLYKEIVSCKNGTFFNKDDLLNLIKNDKTLKNELNEGFKILNIGFFVFKINFSDENQIKTSLIFVNKNLKINEFKDIYESLKNTIGSFIIYKNTLILFLNIDIKYHYDAKTFYHEFTHFKFPLKEGRIANDSNFKLNDLNILKDHGINLSLDQLNYLMTEDEQNARINDFCYSLNIMKEKRFNKKSRKSFIKKLFKTLNDEKPLESNFIKIFNYYTNDMIECVVFYASFYLNHNFEKIKSIIENYFK